MITKFDIESTVYKSLKHYIDKNNYQINTQKDKDVFILVDNKSRIVAVSREYQTIKALATFDKFLFSGFWMPTMGNVLPNFDLVLNQAWAFQLNKSKTEWVSSEFESVDELKQCILFNQKAVVLDRILMKINGQRAMSVNNNTLQTRIDLLRYLEAKQVIQNGVDGLSNLEYPYTSGYADVNNMLLQTAAKAIVLEQDMQSGFLAETETLRMKFEKLVCDETDITKLKDILEEFNKVNTAYGNI